LFGNTICARRHQPNRWGFAGSPLIWRDLVIYNAGPTARLDRNTGRLVWSTGTNAAGYASPLLMGEGRIICSSLPHNI
jgi:hypothetical protein